MVKGVRSTRAEEVTRLRELLYSWRLVLGQRQAQTDGSLPAAAASKPRG
jgi:hypothetical protein